jgi:hypothetical protein
VTTVGRHARRPDNHIKTAHADAPDTHKYRCATCDEEFMACATWLDHMRDEHEDVA